MNYKLTEEIKKDLKTAYPDTTLKVYSFKEGMDIDIVFKLLTRNDQLEISGDDGQPKDLSVTEAHQAVYKACVVWPDLSEDELMKLPVGYLPTISKVIQEKSGFKKIDITGRIIGPETSVWEISELQNWGDPSADELIDLKQKYKEYGLRRVKMDRMVFIVKPVLRGDLNLANLALDSTLTLCQSSVVWPEPGCLNKIGAGYINELLDIILNYSGWSDEFELEVEDL